MPSNSKNNRSQSISSIHRVTIGTGGTTNLSLQEIVAIYNNDNNFMPPAKREVIGLYNNDTDSTYTKKEVIGLYNNDDSPTTKNNVEYTNDYDSPPPTKKEAIGLYNNDDSPTTTTTTATNKKSTVDYTNDCDSPPPTKKEAIVSYNSDDSPTTKKNVDYTDDCDSPPPTKKKTIGLDKNGLAEKGNNNNSKQGEIGLNNNQQTKKIKEDEKDYKDVEECHEEPQKGSKLKREWWFFGDISRVDAEDLLISCNSNVVLFRNSSHSIGYALSRYDYDHQKMVHFLIQESLEGYKINDSTDPFTYKSLEDMIQCSPICKSFKCVGEVKSQKQ